MLQLEMMTVGPFQSNAFVLWCDETKEGIVVDAGDEAARILDAVKRNEVDVKMIVNTHAHIDHVAALPEVHAALEVPVLMCEKDMPVYDGVEQAAAMFGLPAPGTVAIDKFIGEGDTIEFGELKADILEAPGHSPGSVLLLFNGETPPVGIAGDVLFNGSIGRTDLPYGDHDVMMASLRDKIMPLPDDMVVYSGHGPKTAVGYEKKTNPFLQYLG